MVWYILVVDSDSERQRRLADGLQSEGFEVTAVASRQAVLAHFEQEGLPHLTVIDVALQGADGLKLAQLCSERGAPVILTGEDSAPLAVESLKWADDFVRRPYDIKELSARIRRVFSRISDFSYARSPILHIDDRISFDFAHNQLVIEGQPTSLTPIESRLLHALLRHRGEVVDNQTLLLRVWSERDVYEDTLRVHVHRLRSKLEVDQRNPRYILTERGVGYKLEG